MRKRTARSPVSSRPASSVGVSIIGSGGPFEGMHELPSCAAKRTLPRRIKTLSVREQGLDADWAGTASPRDSSDRDARDAARALVDTEAFEQSRRDRKRVEITRSVLTVHDCSYPAPTAHSSRTRIWDIHSLSAPVPAELARCAAPHRGHDMLRSMIDTS